MQSFFAARKPARNLRARAADRARMWHALLDLLAPLSCAACNQTTTRRALFCAVCAVSALRAQAGVTLTLEDGAQVPCWAPFLYGGALQQAITRWKYRGALGIGARLAQLLACELAQRGPRDWLARRPLPLPSHPLRVAARGFLPSRTLCAALPVRKAPLALLRAVRHSAQQAGLSAQARAQNAAQRFAVEPHGLRAPEPLLLIDDVLTTGATARAACAALRRAGFVDLVVLTLARSES